MNLKDRLKRIQEQKKTEKPKSFKSSFNVSRLINKGWQSCAENVLKREVIKTLPLKTEKNLPPALMILVPDFYRSKYRGYGDFLFFDLETTGLSGGAGTAAFLAAFGRITGSSRLRVTQYLLLDYPGENDFLDIALKEFNEDLCVITYNGKSFDSQILKTRCLMNGIQPPVYWHADLLHPARMLWKNIFADCSQASIEKNALGINRNDDIPGSLAPDIWFEFLKTGITDRLEGICDHNVNDIAGLCSILGVMTDIAEDPINTEYQYDIERLALKWRGFLRRSAIQDSDLRFTGERLLRFSADKGKQRSAYVYGYDLMRRGDFSQSLEYVKKALKLFEKDTDWHGKLLRRKERLEKIIKLSGNSGS